MTARRAGAVLCAVLSAVVWLPIAGCSGSRGSPAMPGLASPDLPAPVRASSPYIVMTDREVGWAVWHAGNAWLLLHTDDAFEHVTNRTPVAVPTDGGLVGAFSLGRAGVAVEASERLVRSPVLTTAGASPTWLPQQLPGAVADARDALSVGPGPVSAVTSAAGGTLLSESAGGWRPLTDARTLVPSGALRIDSVVWSRSGSAWLTGHGSPGVHSAFVTRDAGSSWTPVPVTGPSSVATLAPCGSGAVWALPVLDTSHRMTVFRTVDGGATWAAGTPVRQPRGVPAWGCHDRTVWAAAGTGRGDHLEASADGGRSWSDRGAVPDGLTSLVPTGDGRGVATTGGDHARIFAVSADGSQFSARTLPAWVGRLGQNMPDMPEH